MRRMQRVDVLVGFLAFVICLGALLALLAYDLNNEQRRAERQLDVTGQSLVEGLRRSLNTIEVTLVQLAPNQLDEAGPAEERLEVLAAAPQTVAVGTATSDGAIEWSSRRVAGLPESRTELIVDGPTATGDILHLAEDSDLLIAHRYDLPGDWQWDVVYVDMAKATDTVIPEALSDSIEWSLTPQSEDLEVSEPLVHREYLILGEEATWQFELQWTEDTLRGQGVGVDTLAIPIGIVFSVVLGIAASKWVARHDLEVELKTSQQLVEQKDLLLLALSHQLRTPLTAVIGFLSLSQEKAETQVPIEHKSELIELAREQAEEAAQIVEDLLVAARLQEGDLVVVPRQVDLIPVVEAVFDATRRGADETLEVAEVHGRIRSLADPVRVRQLIRNVFDAGRESGAKEWSLRAWQAGSVELVLYADARLSEDDKLPLLSYERATAHQPVSAVRPHLAIANRLSRAMDGALTVVRRGETSEVRIFLPAYQEEGTVTPRTEVSDAVAGT